MPSKTIFTQKGTFVKTVGITILLLLPLQRSSASAYEPTDGLMTDEPLSAEPTGGPTTTDGRTERPTEPTPSEGETSDRQTDHETYLEILAAVNGQLVPEPDVSVVALCLPQVQVPRPERVGPDLEPHGQRANRVPVHVVPERQAPVERRVHLETVGQQPGNVTLQPGGGRLDEHVVACRRGQKHTRKHFDKRPP